MTDKIRPTLPDVTASYEHAGKITVYNGASPHMDIAINVHADADDVMQIEGHRLLSVPFDLTNPNHVALHNALRLVALEEMGK